MNNTPRTLPLPKCLNDIYQKNKQSYFPITPKYAGHIVINI